MNVFDTVCHEYSSDDRAYMLSEYALDIAIAKAENNYMFESGLYELSENKIYTENTENTDAERQNSFVKAIKSICAAIRNFITDIVESITTAFSGKEELDPDEYFDSPTAKIRFKNDARELERVIDDEMRKGNKMLQSITNAANNAGVPVTDEQIDGWIQTASDKIENLAPVLIPAATGWGFKKIFSGMLNKQKKSVDEAEKSATSGKVTDPENQRKVNKIIGFFNKLTKEIGHSTTEWGKSIRAAKKDNNDKEIL